MATLQYVGARYVPKFYSNPNGTWDWQSGVRYEPLTIVRFGENTYTSKAPVPENIGSPNQNPAYWAMTGNYNGAIIEIQDELNRKLPIIGGYEKKRVLLISDSYEEWSGWASTCKTNLAAVGVQCDISARSGASFGNAANSFYSLYQSSPNRGSYTDVIVGGGVNDYSQSSAARNTGIRNIMGACARDKCLFHFANFGDFWHHATDRLALWTCYTEETNLIYDLGGAVVPNCFGLLHWEGDFASDGIHPSALGGALLARHMEGYIMGGNMNVMRQVNDGGGKLLWISGNMVSATYNTVPVHATITGQTDAKVGKVSEMMPLLNPGNSIYHGNAIFVQNEGNPRELLHVEYRIFADDFSMRVLDRGGTIVLDGSLYGVNVVLPKGVI